MDAFDKAIRHFARGTKTNAPEKAEGVKKKLAALRGDDPAASGQQPKRVAAMLRPRPVSRGSEPSMASLPIAASLPDPWDMATAR